MPYQFIIRLIKLFNLKEDILEEMKKLIKPINDIINDPALAYMDEYRKVILEPHSHNLLLELFRHHNIFVHKETGFLPLVNNLIETNNQLVHYQDDNDKMSIRDKFGINMSQNLAQCELEVHKSYLRMMSLVEKEQYFLIKWFKPTLEEISKKTGHPEVWKEHLKHFGNLLDLIEADLKFFHILTKKLEERGYLDFLMKPSEEEIKKNKDIIVNNVVKSIEGWDLNGAVKWINYGQHHEWLTKEEYSFLRYSINAVEEKDIKKLEDVTSKSLFSSIFNENEKSFFAGFLDKIKTERRIQNRIEIKREIIQAIENNDFRKISDQIGNEKTLLSFTQDEIRFLIDLINSITTNHVKRLEELISESMFSRIFDFQEANFFRQLLEKKKIEVENQRVSGELSELSRAVRQGGISALERML